MYELERCDSIGSDDAVLFVNPTKYSIDPEDLEDSSAFEEITPDSSEDNSKVVSEVDIEQVQKQVQLGFRDKRQLKRLKKQQAATPTN
jgi:hypothetical protein